MSVTYSRNCLPSDETALKNPTQPNARGPTKPVVSYTTRGEPHRCISLCPVQFITFPCERSANAFIHGLHVAYDATAKFPNERVYRCFPVGCTRGKFVLEEMCNAFLCSSTSELQVSAAWQPVVHVRRVSLPITHG